MGKVQFLVFNKLNLTEYKLFETEENNLIGEIINKIGGENADKINGYSTHTSAWMNRFACLNNGNKRYIIVPNTIPSCNDIVKATTDKYAIFLLDDKGFTDFTEDDITYFQENLSNEFNIDKITEKKYEFEEDFARFAIRETFRIPLHCCSDDTVEIIRFLLLNNMRDIFTDLVLGGIKMDEDIIIKIFNKLKLEPQFENISIAVDRFIKEIIMFFRPEIYFKDIGIGTNMSLYLYLELCEEGNWLREQFLTISEKEAREKYREFLVKDMLNFIKNQ